MSALTRILFVSDIHGSDRCFRKFLSATRAPSGFNVQIIGGDITGKYVVPIVEKKRNTWVVRFEGRTVEFAGAQDVERFERSLGEKGVYSWRCDPVSAKRFQNDPDFREAVDRERRTERLRAWVDLADRWLRDSECRIFMSGGNDDPWYIDPILQQSKFMMWPEGKVLPISDSLVMLSTGVANITPWKCPRDVPEEEIAARIESMATQVDDFSRCIFNVHCPPFGTLLDRAPKLDTDLRVVASAFGVEEESVGSHAVRRAIEHYQPAASLHGHIHESRAFQRIGRTLCMNPGSEYSVGRLSAAFLEFDGPKLNYFELVRDLE